MKLTLQALLLLAALCLLSGAAFLPPLAGEGEGAMQESDSELYALIDGMNDQQLIGQLLMFGYKGTVPDAGLVLIDELSVGNMIIMKANYENPQQLQSATNALQRAAVEHNGLGMLVAVDQEGGRINRITGEPIVVFQSAHELGQSLDPRWASEIGAATGRQMRALGLNLVLAPVIDVEVDPDNYLSSYGRCFGSDPQLVAQWGAGFVQGFTSAGVASCAKHFPSYAAEVRDPHTALAINPADLQTMRQREFIPFTAAISAGAPLVMTAHVSLPAITGSDSLPATFSADVMNGLLRGELGFDGVIITDDMNMKSAVVKDPAELPLLALQGGSDIYLLVHDPDRQRQVAAVLLAALQDGRLPRSQVEESVLRVLRVKQRFGLLRPELPGAAELAAHIGPQLYETLPGRQSTQ